MNGIPEALSDMRQDIDGLKRMYRIGKVCETDAGEYTARVIFNEFDEDEIKSWPLKVLYHSGRWLPAIDDMVLCLYLPDGHCDGFIIGRL